MTYDAEQAAGWMLSGFQSMTVLWIWIVAVVLYGLFWRSMSRPEPDPIRPSGPIG